MMKSGSADVSLRSIRGAPQSLESIGSSVGIALSGGGSHGAFAAGIMHRAFSVFYQQRRLPRVSVVAGTSTGSLVAGLIAQFYGRYKSDPDSAGHSLDAMKRVYTTTQQGQVGYKPDGILGIGFNLLVKHGVMDIAPLRQLIEEHYEHDHIQAALAGDGPLAYVCSYVDMVSGQQEHAHSDAAAPPSAEQMKAAIFASCAQPVVMTPAYVGHERRWAVDGGVREVIPFREPMRRGCTSMLAVALNEPQIDGGRGMDEASAGPASILPRVERGLSVMNDEVARDDERLAMMIAYINRAKESLVAQGVPDDVVRACFPPKILCDDVDPSTPGNQDPYEDAVYNQSKLRDLLVFRFESQDLPSQEKFGEETLRPLFDKGVAVADAHMARIRELLFAAGALLIRRRSMLLAAAALPLGVLFARRSRAASSVLVPDPNRILDLPEGFSYTILQERYADMSDGYRVPNGADGMACFDPGDGSLVLMRNHELAIGAAASGPYKDGQSPPAEAFDAQAMGGVTRLVLDARTLQPLSSNLVLTGTVMNCCGGVSPWGWLSCEESELDGHGYVFVCAVDAERVRKPERIPGYGRFKHEAAHVDPRTRIAYLTEDQPTGCLYRFVPAGSDPFVGKLQALALASAPRYQLTRMQVGQKLDVRWVDVDDPEGTPVPVQTQAQARGAAIVARGEGLWLHEGVVYFVATAGGPISRGQVFRLTPVADGGTLELIVACTDPEKLESPDNIAVHPLGGIVLAEDGRNGNYIRGIDPKGQPFDLARNAGSNSEFAGVCFAPSGDVLFANIQHDGLTLAIRGPLRELFGASPAPEPQSSEATPPHDDAVPAPGDPGAPASGCSCREPAQG